jgi:hypothetical protein
VFGSFRSRLRRLERRAKASRVDPTQVHLNLICGTVQWDDLDPFIQEAVAPLLAEAERARNEVVGNHPAMAVLRSEWRRLGIPDPGECGDLDPIEEALRLVSIPTPLSCGLKELPGNGQAPPPSANGNGQN